jgi:hypothetical protein
MQDPNIAEPTFQFWRAFTAVMCAWIIAQLLKIVGNTNRHKKFNFRWLFETGGMPSAHSAGTAAVATVVGLYSGFDSAIFLLALAFAVVTMFDAASVRRAVGRQTIILNKMIDEAYAQNKFPEKRLKEFLGHTPIEVLAGAFLGIFLSLAIYYF